MLGIDAAAPVLELARAKAASQGLANIEFRCGDATRTGLAGRSFDAVLCVFGVFFAPDMAAFLQEMWRMVRPGGVLAVTTWGGGPVRTGQQPVLAVRRAGRAVAGQSVQPLG